MNVFNIKTNSKLYRYFNGKNKNVLATILAFDTINVSAFTSHPDSLSSEIKKAKINELKLENKHLNIKIACLLLYDHTKCKITRYLLNVNEPFEVVVIKDETKSKFEIVPFEYNLTNDSKFKDLVVLDNKVIKNLCKEDRVDNKFLSYLSDGRLNKTFILNFIIYLLNTRKKVHDVSYNNIFDYRIINALHNRLLDFNKEKVIIDKITNEKVLFQLDRERPFIVNIPKNLHGILDRISELTLNQYNIKFIPYLAEDLPPVINDLKSQLNFKSIQNQPDLDQRIIKFNNLNLKRFEFMSIEHLNKKERKNKNNNNNKSE